MPSDRETWSPETPRALTVDELDRAPVGTDRYVIEELLGTGSMGEVHRVRDLQLNRRLAMKIVRGDRKVGPSDLARFVEEAQATAQLQHPGIVPVHEIGVAQDGRPWFTMRQVTGETLRQALVRSLANAPDAPSLRQLISALLDVCEAVAYAHDRGVIHRDLKPENILLGSFGEVWVVDWGLAKVLGRAVLASDNELPVQTARTTDNTFSTRHGQVAGTPRYMAPEQWEGDLDAIGPPTDVYALGGVLCEILIGEPRPDPFLPCAAPELLEVVERAKASAPADRHPDAAALAVDLRQWLDGEARTEEARKLVADARATGVAIAELSGELAPLIETVAELEETLPPLAPLDEKRRLWSLQDEIRGLERERALKQVEHVQLLRSALARDPDLSEAREGMADHYQRLHAEAERARDAEAAVRFEALLRAYDTGKWASWLAGTGTLTVHTDPPGAEVDLLCHVERDRRLVPEFDRFLGHTPIDAADIPLGSYLVRIRSPGRADVHYPVRIGRELGWDGCAPGADTPWPIPLPTGLDHDEVYVPGGWTTTGGDDDAIGSLARRHTWVDGFVVQRFAVTAAEYGAFLDALGPTATDHADPDGWVQVDGQWTAHGQDPRLPAFYVSWHDAMAFAAWTAERSGLPWRLPTELEWEKAARGVDERLFPWGDHLDPTFAAYMASHGEGGPRPVSVEAFESDCSPYGVRGMAGTASEWVADSYHRFGLPPVDGRVPRDQTPADADVVRVQRGGTWGLAERRVRLCTRWWQDPRVRHNMCGLRLVRSWP